MNVKSIALGMMFLFITSLTSAYSVPYYNKDSKTYTFEVKINGSIREIEFIVQSLQLIQGGSDKRLRERNTLKVLPLLVGAKLLPQDVADCLSHSYRFLRRLEHCIQELAEKQTQQLPQSKSEQKDDDE